METPDLPDGAAPADKLRVIADAVRAGKTPRYKLRTLLAVFGQARRGAVVNQRIADALATAGLRTEPDFQGAWIEEYLHFVPLDAPAPPPAGGDGTGQNGGPPPDSTTLDGPEGNGSSPGVPDGGAAFRVRRFVSDEKRGRLVGIAPTASVAEAVALMLDYDFSQLPIMPNEKSVTGLVSWRSIGRRFALGAQPATVQEARETVPVEELYVSVEDPVARLVAVIQRHEVALIREGRTFVTIFTAADLGDLYRDLSEAFILLGEIETVLRSLLARGRFTPAELDGLRGPGDAPITRGVEDLSFGTYGVLVGDGARWSRLGLHIDRAWFVRTLDEVRVIRNAVMHFHPNGVSSDDTDRLARFCAVLRTLRDESPSVP